MANRRSAEEVKKLVDEVNKLVAGGMTIEDACKKTGLSRSVFQRAVVKAAGGAVKVTKPGARGRIDVRSLPPRPKGGKGGRRSPKPVDMNDVASVAIRISRLDRKLAGIEDLREERLKLSTRLMALLKKG